MYRHACIINKLYMDFMLCSVESIMYLLDWDLGWDIAFTPYV